MKTKYWIIALGILLAICIGLSIPVLMPGRASSHAEILSEGTVIRTVDLSQDQHLTIVNSKGGVNIVTVQDGKIAVTEASCPDHYCMHRGFCDSGSQIVCLPNLLIIRFTDVQEIDFVVG